MSEMNEREARKDLAYEQGELNDYTLTVSATVRKRVTVRGCRSEAEAKQKVLDGDFDIEFSDDNIDWDTLEFLYRWR